MEDKNPNELSERGLTTLMEISFAELEKALWKGKPILMPDKRDTKTQFHIAIEKWAKNNKMPDELAKTHPYLKLDGPAWSTFQRPPQKVAPAKIADAMPPSPDKSTPMPYDRNMGDGFKNRGNLRKMREDQATRFRVSRPQVGGHALLTGVDDRLRQVFFKNPNVWGDSANNRDLINPGLIAFISVLSGPLDLVGTSRITGPTHGLLRGTDIAGLWDSVEGLMPNKHGMGIDCSGLGRVKEITQLLAPGTRMIREAIEQCRQKRMSKDDADKQIQKGLAQWQSVSDRVERLSVWAPGLRVSPPDPSDAWLKRTREDRLALGICPWRLVPDSVNEVRLISELLDALTDDEFDRTFESLVEQAAKEEVDREKESIPRVMSISEIRDRQENHRLALLEGGVDAFRVKYPNRLIITETSITVAWPLPDTAKILERPRLSKPSPFKVRHEPNGRMFVGEKLVFDPTALIPSNLKMTETVCLTVERNTSGFVTGVREVRQKVRPSITYGDPTSPKVATATLTPQVRDQADHRQNGESPASMDPSTNSPVRAGFSFRRPEIRIGGKVKRLW